MKFNWGTGILVFLILFLSASAVFIFFAMRQDVNLVHEDYYEQGVDYSAQMNVDARSAEYKDSFKTYIEDGSLVVDFGKSLALSIDSGSVLLFRPSSSSLDVSMPFGHIESSLKIPRSNLVAGRYILKLSWYSSGLKYEVDETIFIE
jgi:hypothetical protein